MSFLTTEPLTLHGGCNCRAIRYSVALPPEHERQIMLPSEKSNGQGDIRIPQAAICFCNDCRRASGGIVLAALLAPRDTTFSLSRRGTDERLEFVATDRFPPKEITAVGDTSMLEDTFLGVYRSSDKALRAFCTRCGTPALYAYIKELPPGGTSSGLDLYLGTLEREDVERLGGLDRFVRADDGIEWVKRLFVTDERVRWHAGTNMAECMKS